LAFGGSTSADTKPHTHNQSLVNDGGQLSGTLTDMDGVTLLSLINAASTEVNPDHVVMDYSTTIGDYTTPTSATGSSAATPGVFTIEANSANDNPQAVIDLHTVMGGMAGGTWTLRTKLSFAGYTNNFAGQGVSFEMGMSDTATATGSSPAGIDWIQLGRAAHGALTDQNPQIRQYNAAVANDAQGGVLIASPFTATRYVQLQRKGTNDIEQKEYSDSSYTTLLETITINPTTAAATNLRYLLTRLVYQAVTDVNVVTIGAISFYNNTLTPITPTWEWDGSAVGWTTTNNGGVVTLTAGSGASNAVDDNLVTFWESSAAANNWIYVDVGSEKDLSQMTIYPNAATTETQYKIQYSNDLVTWTDLRLINVSALTNAAYNYIRFNTVSARYVRIYGNSGAAEVMAINEIKIDETNEVATEHGHLEIDPTDVTLSLDGTSP